MIAKTNAWKKIQDEYGNKLNDIQYDIVALPYSNNEIIVGTKEAFINYTKYYLIPVKHCSGMAIKINKKSISCDSGNAVDAIKILDKYPAFLSRLVTEIIFKNGIKEFKL